MPSWKKVITSGSNAQLNQLTASSFNLVGSGTGELEVEGNITASGNISASGNFNSAHATVDGILTATANINNRGSRNVSLPFGGFPGAALY